jgi:hypothetical protein
MSRGEDGGQTKTTKQKLASPVPGETTKGPETTELAETEKAMTKYEAWSSVTPNLTKIPPKREKTTRGLRLALSESTKTMKELDTEPAETMGLETELIGPGLTLSESQTKTKMALSESWKTRVALSESRTKTETKRPLTLSESPKTTAEVWSSISPRARGLGMEPATKTELDQSCYTYWKRSNRL